MFQYDPICVFVLQLSNLKKISGNGIQTITENETKLGLGVDQTTWLIDLLESTKVPTQIFCTHFGNSKVISNFSLQAKRLSREQKKPVVSNIMT